MSKKAKDACIHALEVIIEICGVLAIIVPLFSGGRRSEAHHPLRHGAARWPS